MTADGRGADGDQGINPPVIVVGCDGGPRSDAALVFAAEEAELRGAQLVIVITYSRPFDPDLDQSEISDAALGALAHAEADRAYRRALGPATSIRAPQIVTVPGDPARALIQQSRNALMIVIARRNRSLLVRMFGHLTGRKLVLRAGVPLVIVPSSD